MLDSHLTSPTQPTRKQLRTLKYLVLPDATTTNTSAAAMHRDSRKRRVSFLFSIAGVQLVCAWLLT